MMGKHPKRFNVSTLVVTTARLRTKTGAYQNSSSVSCHPFLFWATLHVDNCIAPLGKLLASIPASQASVERVFSTADWLATNRDRLGFRKLARDTFILGETHNQ